MVYAKFEGSDKRGSEAVLPILQKLLNVGPLLLVLWPIVRGDLGRVLGAEIL